MSYDHCKPVTTRRVITDSSFVWWVSCSVSAVTLTLCLIAEGGLDSSFGYCSAECRDRCELERAKSEVTRALEEFEVNPERGSTQAPAKEPVSHNATPHVQPLTRPRLQSEDTPTIVGAACRAPPTQQSPPPQEQRTVSVHCYKVSLEAVRAMSLYDSGKLQTVWGIKGVSSLLTG